jgi:hypothetical protein
VIGWIAVVTIEVDGSIDLYRTGGQPEYRSVNLSRRQAHRDTWSNDNGSKVINVITVRVEPEFGRIKLDRLIRWRGDIQCPIALPRSAVEGLCLRRLLTVEDNRKSYDSQDRGQVRVRALQV